MPVKIDAFCACIKESGEKFYGGQAKIIQNELGTAAILVDGKSDGVKESLLTAFAVKILATMVKSGISIREAADMILEFQSADGTGTIAFTLLLAHLDGQIDMEQFEAPKVLLFRRGKPFQVHMSQRVLRENIVLSGVLPAKQTDTVLAVTSGLLNAGAQRNPENCWNLETMSKFMENAYQPKASAENLVRLLLAAGKSLAFDKPKQDFSALAIRITK